MSYRIYEVRGEIPEDFKEADEICRELINIDYHHIRGDDGRFFLAIKYTINYLNKFGIEEVRHPSLLANLNEAIEASES